MFKKAHYVYEIFKEGSFTKAAEKLYISQPCLSVAIKKLEDSLGTALFERTTSDVRPTAAGLEYIRTAEKIFALEDAFKDYLKDAAPLRQNETIRIGAADFVFSNILLSLVEKFSAQYPSVDLSLTEASSVEIARLVSNGEVDIIVDSYDKENPEFSYRKLREEEILLAVPASDSSMRDIEEKSISPIDIYEGKFNTGEHLQVPLSKFRDEKFILLKSGNSMNYHAMTAFKSSGFTPRVTMLFDQLLTSLNHAKEIGAVCFITDTIFKYKRFDDSIRLYRIKECGSRSFGIITSKNKTMSFAAEKFMKQLFEVFEDKSILN